MKAPVQRAAAAPAGAARTRADRLLLLVVRGADRARDVSAGLAERFSAAGRRFALHAHHRAAGASRHDHRSLRRAARHQHAGGIGLGEPGGVRHERRRNAVSCASCSAWTSGSSRASCRRQRPRVRLPEAASAARSWRRTSCSSACPASPSSASIAATTPPARSTAQLIGITDVDDRGQEGIELAYQDWLSGKARQPPRDQGPARARGRGCGAAARPDRRPRSRAVDRSQAAVSRLSRAEGGGAARARARPASIVVLDVKTGEVLALANLPAFNPNNRATLDVRRSAQSRDHRYVRARFDAEAVHGRGRARGGRDPTQHRAADCARLSGRGRCHDPRCPSRRHADGGAGDPEVVQRRRRQAGAGAAARSAVEHAFRRRLRHRVPARLSGRGRRAGCAPISTGVRSSRRPCLMGMAFR